MDGENRDVSPKDKPSEIQCNPIAASSPFGGRQIQEVDGNRQQPKKQTNDQMFAPGGRHKAFVYNNARSAPIKKVHLYPLFLSTSRKKWEDSTAQRMIQDNCKSVL
jgi:hypothetical protein